MLLVSLPAVLLSTRAKRQGRGLTPNKSPLSYSYGHFRTKAGETVSHWLLMVPLTDELAFSLSSAGARWVFLHPFTAQSQLRVRAPELPERAQAYDRDRQGA